MNFLKSFIDIETCHNGLLKYGFKKLMVELPINNDFGVWIDEKDENFEENEYLMNFTVIFKNSILKKMDVGMSNKLIENVRQGFFIGEFNISLNRINEERVDFLDGKFYFKLNKNELIPLLKDIALIKTEQQWLDSVYGKKQIRNRFETVQCNCCI